MMATESRAAIDGNRGPISRADAQDPVLKLARDWKAGHLRPVHPTIGRLFNAALHRVGEDPVPFRRSTNDSAPSLVELIESEYRKVVAA